jgi:hypothetical protein
MMFRSYGVVYIFINQEASLLKIGMSTCTSENRLIDINQIWLGSKGTCQVCRTRLRLNLKRRIPNHVKSRGKCFGGNQKPLERDQSLALSLLENLKLQHNLLEGAERMSNTRRIKGLETNIKNFQNIGKRVGVWKLQEEFHCINPEQVEKLVHKKLSKFEYNNMPFGEVFNCSLDTAKKAVLEVLDSLDNKSDRFTLVG